LQAVEKPKFLSENFEELKMFKMTETTFSDEVKKPFISETIIVSFLCKSFVENWW
jgi:hypothetical protein